jgi:hypothetical protein
MVHDPLVYLYMIKLMFLNNPEIRLGALLIGGLAWGKGGLLYKVASLKFGFIEVRFPASFVQVSCIYTAVSLVASV